MPDEPDRLPPGIYRLDFDDEHAPPFEGVSDLESAAWLGAGCAVAFCVLAVGLGILWLLGVAR
jgi:hypothetical protein